MFRLSLLSVGLAQALNSLRSRKKSDHNAVKFSYELNFRHLQFISYLFTIHSQGLVNFTPHGIHFNHDSRNSFFLSNHDSQSTKKPYHGVTKLPLPLLFIPYGRSKSKEVKRKLKIECIWSDLLEWCVNYKKATRPDQWCSCNTRCHLPSNTCGITLLSLVSLVGNCWWCMSFEKDKSIDKKIDKIQLTQV